MKQQTLTVANDQNQGFEQHHRQIRRDVFLATLSGMDGQPTIPVERPALWRAQHHRINRALLDAIAERMGDASANPAVARIVT